MAGRTNDWDDVRAPHGPGRYAGRDADDGADPDVDPRLAAGVEHLQRAAKEAIDATRALLDVVEDLVEDPRAARSMLGALGTVAGAASDLAGRARSGRSGEGERDGPDDDPGVQRIPVA